MRGDKSRPDRAGQKEGEEEFYARAQSSNEETRRSWIPESVRILAFRLFFCVCAKRRRGG